MLMMTEVIYLLYFTSLRDYAHERDGRISILFKKNSRIDRSEMSFHSPNFLLEYLVPETSLEFTLS